MLSEMQSAPVTLNITEDFIKTMIPHHLAAILMSKNLLNFSNYEPLVDIAKEIIIVQRDGIMKMENILKTLKNYQNSYFDVSSYLQDYNLIFNKMIRGMKNSLKSSNINLDFISEMLPHHKGAVEMCENVLNYPISPCLKNLALMIMEVQSKGIKKLEIIQKNLQKKQN